MFSAIQVLIGSGADVNIKDDYSSATRIARQQRVHTSQSKSHDVSHDYHSTIVADVRDKEFCSFINHYSNYSGFTPLHYAIIKDDERIVKYLLEHGSIVPCHVIVT